MEGGVGEATHGEVSSRDESYLGSSFRSTGIHCGFLMSSSVLTCTNESRDVGSSTGEASVTILPCWANVVERVGCCHGCCGIKATVQSDRHSEVWADFVLPEWCIDFWIHVDGDRRAFKRRGHDRRAGNGGWFKPRLHGSERLRGWRDGVGVDAGTVKVRSTEYEVPSTVHHKCINAPPPGARRGRRILQSRLTRAHISG